MTLSGLTPRFTSPSIDLLHLICTQPFCSFIFEHRTTIDNGVSRKLTLKKCTGLARFLAMQVQYVRMADDRASFLEANNSQPTGSPRR